MEYRIEQDPAYSLLGLTLETTMADGKCLREIPPFWETLREDGRLGALEAIAGSLGVCGVCHGFTGEGGAFLYSIAIQSPEPIAALPEGLTEIDIPASLWGKVVHRGPIDPGFQETIQHACAEWLPSSGFRHAGTPELEIYHPGDQDGPDNVCEYWIPLARP